MALTTADFKRIFLRDLPLTDSLGRPMSDADIEYRRGLATAAFERKYTVKLSPTVIKMGDKATQGDPPLTGGDLPYGVSTQDPQTYDPRSFENNRFVSIRLPIGPVVSLYGISLDLPGAISPYHIPDNWYNLNRQRKIVQMYPKGVLTQFPWFASNSIGYVALEGDRAIPNAWLVTYMAGYTTADLESDQADVAAAVAKYAAIECLIPGSADLSFQIGVAGRSVSVDGLSQSTQLMQNANALKYKPLIDQYLAELKGWEKTYSQRKSGVIFDLL